MKHEPGCAGCGFHEPEIVFEVPRAPASVGCISRSRNEALNATCGVIKLAACMRCGLISNRSFDHAIAGFRPGYEVSLQHSPVFREFIQGVAERLIDRYGLKGRHILEIGCGAGEFLRLICAAGANHGVGIDPTLARAATEEVGAGTVQFIPDYYSKSYAHYLGDFVCCLSVFEAIPQPLAFLKELRESIGERSVSLYFEVFNGYRSIVQQEVWSIHYEQCNYFSLESLTGIFRRAGFEVLHAGTCYQGDQYLYVEAVPSNHQEPSTTGQRISALVASSESLETSGDENESISPRKSATPAGFQEVIRGFGELYRDRYELWQRRFQGWHAAGKTVVVWGSGGKGISFLSAVPNAKHVAYVVDINPNRQAHFMPVTGHDIVGPEQLTKRPPDVVILTNALYRTEIEAQLEDLGIDCQTMVA